MKLLFTGIALISISLIATAQEKSTAGNRLAGIDSILLKVLNDHHVAGFSIAVVEQNKLLYSKGFGYRDIQHKKPVTPNTLFAIGSCTKAFTAALLGQLEKKGAVSLDGKAREYLPGLHFYNDDLDNTVTIRDMMCHRTGLSGYAKSWYVFNTPSRDSMLTRIQYMKPIAPLREKWQYNNYMYMVQGMIAEKITGKSWEENIQEKIFTPLGMKRSNTSIQNMLKDEDAALPYGTEEERTPKEMDYYEMESMSPAGGINSSANEMAAWLMAWTNGGSYNGTEIIPSGFVQAATSSQMVVNSGLPGNQGDIHFLNYGLGWFLRSYRGHYQVEHDGNIDGFSSWIAFFPKEQLGIIVLTNQQYSPVPQIVSNILSDRLLQLKPVNWNMPAQQAAATASPVSGRIPNTNPSHRMSEYQGLFENPTYGDIQIYVQNDSLFATFGKGRMWLKHYHYDVFETKKIHHNTGIDTTVSDLHINIRFGENGKVESITVPLEGSTEPTIEFMHVQRAVTVSRKDLEKYTGEYALENMIVKVYIKENSLRMQAPGQPEYELVPLGNHHFNISGLSGYSIEFEATDTSATAFTFIKPDGTSFKVTKKQ